MDTKVYGSEILPQTTKIPLRLYMMMVVALGMGVVYNKAQILGALLLLITPKGPGNQKLVIPKFDDRSLEYYNHHIRSVNLDTFSFRECG